MPQSHYDLTTIMRHTKSMFTEQCSLKFLPCIRARSQVLSFLGGAKSIFRGQDFCFHYVFKTIFMGTTKFGEHCPQWPRGYRLVCIHVCNWKCMIFVHISSYTVNGIIASLSVLPETKIAFIKNKPIATKNIHLWEK